MVSNIVAVTACVRGVAHTYMAADGWKTATKMESQNRNPRARWGWEQNHGYDIAHVDVVLLVTGY